MATFFGHISPGALFTVMALWHAFNQLVSYYRSRTKFGPAFRSQASYPSDIFTCCHKIQLEGVMKIVCSTTGFIGQIASGFKNGQFVSYQDGQHATMFFFLGMSGMVDILLYHNVPLPANSGYVASCLALIVEGVLFKFHLHGRTDLDVLIHTLLVYTVFAQAIALMVEMRYRNHVLVSLTTSFCLMLQGTWFWQVGFILYNPIPGAVDWKQDDHNQMMLACMIFTWHMGAAFITLMLMGVAVCRYCDAWNRDNFNIDCQMQRLVQQNGTTMVDVNDDSDMEFQP